MVAAKVGDGRKVPSIQFESVSVITRHILPYIGLAYQYVAQGQIRHFHSHFVLVLYIDSCAQRHDYTNTVHQYSTCMQVVAVYIGTHAQYILLHNIWYFVKLMAYAAVITHVNIETTYIL